ERGHLPRGVSLAASFVRSLPGEEAEVTKRQCQEGAISFQSDRSRLWHQAQYSSTVGRPRLRVDCRASDNGSQSDPEPESRRNLSLQWPRRSRARHLRHRHGTPVGWQEADFRYLSWPSNSWFGPGRANLQVEVRTSGRQPPSPSHAHRTSGDYRPEPRF